jgi:hypothetical protein
LTSGIPLHPTTNILIDIFAPHDKESYSEPQPRKSRIAFLGRGPDVRACGIRYGLHGQILFAPYSSSRFFVARRMCLRLGRRAVTGNVANPGFPWRYKIHCPRMGEFASTGIACARTEWRTNICANAIAERAAGIISCADGESGPDSSLCTHHVVWRFQYRLSISHVTTCDEKSKLDTIRGHVALSVPRCT